MDDRLGKATDAPALDPGLIQAAEAFLPGAEVIEPLAGRGYVARVRQADSSWKVRRWPEATTRGRVDFVHRALGAVGQENPVVAPRALVAPNGESSAVINGAVYDAQSWLPGAPVLGGPETRVQNGRWAPLPANVPDDVFADMLRSLAMAHGRTAELAMKHPLVEAPMAQLIAAVNQAWRAQRGVLRPLAASTPAVRRWLGVGERALPAAETAIAAGGESVERPAVCHFGLWPAHVIVADAGESGAAGLIGWEQCNVGSPLIDIAQAVSRFRGWTAAGAEMAIAAYGEVLPLRPEERRLLPAITALDLVATSGQMLIYAYSDRPGAARPLTPLREAARSLLDSLDVATNTLNAQDRPKRAASDRGRRPGGPRDQTLPKTRRPRGPQKKR
jgi:Ser/Thr protein kinase RdoA (MazF antagonist)